MSKKIIRIISCFLSFVLIFSMCCSAEISQTISIPTKQFNTNPEPNYYSYVNAPYPNYELPYGATEGEFWIKNTTHNLYLRDLDFFSVVLESYSGESNQKWRLISAENGEYFKIQNVYSNRYLTVPEDSNNGDYIELKSLYTDYRQNRQLWKLTRTIGGFKISPKLNEDTLLMTSTESLNVYGYGVIQSSYDVDNEPWYYWSIEFYDEEVLQNATFSYVNYHDSSFLRPSLITSSLLPYVIPANEFANTAFSNLFGITLVMDGQLSQFNNAISDQCSAGINEPCNNSCGTDCDTTHHKNLWVITQQILETNSEQDHIYVLWANRNVGSYCNEFNGVHTESNAIATVHLGYPVILFENIQNVLPEQDKSCMFLTLVHETAHVFGMGDVYNNVGHETNGTNCVMEKFDPYSSQEFRDNVLSGDDDAFCETCKNTLRPLIIAYALY